MKKLIDSFVLGIDEEITLDFSKMYTDGMTCEPTEKNIYIGLDDDEIENKCFMDAVANIDKDFYNQNNISVFTLGLLHEVGHIFTHNEELEDDYNISTKLIWTLFSTGLINKETQNQAYMNLELEVLATTWAINFCKKFYDYVKEFDNKIQKFLKKELQKIA